MTWELDNPDQSVAVPLRNGPQDLTDRTVAMLFTSPDYADYINEKNARVENPQAGDIYIFKEVNREDFKHVIKMDGAGMDGVPEEDSVGSSDYKGLPATAPVAPYNDVRNDPRFVTR